MFYTASKFTIKATAATARQAGHHLKAHTEGYLNREPAVWMEESVLEAAVQGIAAYCAKFHQPGVLIEFDGVGESDSFSWIRYAASLFRSRMPAECVAPLSVRVDCAGVSETWLDLCRELGIGVTAVVEPPTPQGANRDGDIQPVSLAEQLSAAQRVQQRLGAGGLFMGFECVAVPEADGGEIYQQLRAIGIEAIDFSFPTEVTWENRLRWTALQTPFADFLIGAFDAWWSENNSGVRIAKFDNLLRLIFGNRVHADSFAGDALTEFVVDWDGRLRLTDTFEAYGFDGPSLYVQTDPIERIFQHPSFQFALQAQQSLPQGCSQCGLRGTC